MVPVVLVGAAPASGRVLAYVGISGHLDFTSLRDPLGKRLGGFSVNLANPIQRYLGCVRPGARPDVDTIVLDLVSQSSSTCCPASVASAVPA